MALLPPDQLLHLGPDPAGATWNHFDLGQGLSSHINYPQAQLGNSPPQGDPWWVSKNNVNGIPVVQFSAPLGGATTSTNTQYARCELREYERNGTTKMAFDPKSGDHWIEGIYRIYGLSGLAKPGVCVQQMHDPNDDVIMVRTELSGGVPQLVLNYNGSKVATLNTNYVDGTEFYLKTRVNAGTPSVYYTTNLASIPSTPTHTSSGFFSGASTGWYSKTGSYNQTNESTDPSKDPDASIIKVEVRSLKHWHSATPAGGAWPTPATYDTSPGAGGPTVSAGADTSILPSGTFARTASVTLNGATLSSQQWKIASGPANSGAVLSTSGSVTWVPGNGYTTTGGTRGLGVGGIAKPAPASNVELNGANRGDMNITASGTALVPRIYDGGGFTCGRITVSANYIVIQNYNIRPNSQYAFYCTGSNVTLQNCDIKNVSVSGDGDLNAITLLEGSNIDILYNTSINYVSGDPGSSHTDWIQTWVSSSHPTPVNNVRVIGNKATGPSNPSRDNSIASIHQLIMVESAGHGGNSGGSGTPSNWLVCDNEFGASWGQDVKLDGGNNFTFTRNKFVGSSDHVFSFDAGTGNVVYSDNTFGSGYGNINATVTSGSGPANPISGGGTTTGSYPEGTYILEYDAVTSVGTVSDTVNVVVSSTTGGGGGGGAVTSATPSFVAVGPVASSNGSGTVTVAAPTGVTAGMFQICIIQNAEDESITSVPAGWQLLDDQPVANTDTGEPGGNSEAWVYYNTTGDNASRSWSKSGTRAYHAIRMVWKDWSALGQHLPRESAYTTTPYAPPVTPTTDSALVVTILGSDRTDIAPSPVSVPTGWTQRYNDGVTVNTNEIEWIAVADLVVQNRVTAGANTPTGTGVGTSNFHLTNPDDCSMFSFVLEGVIGSGTTTSGAVSLSAQPRLNVATGPLPIGPISLVALPNLLARTILRAQQGLVVFATLTADARVFPRGALIILPNLTVGAPKQVVFAAILLEALPTLRAGALPYRRPVLRTDYKYPPRNHPFRLIAQRILDGEIVDWELPVDSDFEYTEQLSGPVVMHGSFRPEIISVQELALDGYAYWLHVEINQEIRASAILLPMQYQDSQMSFSAEGIAAAPHYQIYDGVFQQIQVDPLSVVRTIWNYVQSQPQSDLGVEVASISSPVRLGESARTETTVTDNGDGTTTTTIRDIPAKPYELVWWNATNCGEEIDTLAGQTPFDYVERNQWNYNRTDVLHYIDLGYPRIGAPKPDLLFNEENILEVVPMQELEDTYASAVLVIGAGEGQDTIRGYAAESFGDRVRKEVVVTDKSITTIDRANSVARTELAIRRGRTFEISEIVVAAYHANAPIGSYHIGDDIRVAVDIPWLMETHIAWYRITSISNKPSSDKIRLGLSHAGVFDSSTTTEVISEDDFIPTPPPPPAPPINFPQFITFHINSILTVGATLIPAVQAAITLTANTALTPGGIALRSGAVSMVIGKTLTAAGIATAANAATVTLISNKSLTIGGFQVEFAAVSLVASKSLTIGGVTNQPGAVSMTVGKTLTTGVSVQSMAGAVSLGATATLTSNGTIPGRFGFGSSPFGANPFGSDVGANTVFMGATATLTANAGALTGAVTLSAVKTLSVGSLQSKVAAVTLNVLKSLGVNGTVTSTALTLPVVRSVGTGIKSATGDTSITCSKPTGLVANDYLLAIQVGDADTTSGNMSCSALGAALASQSGNPTSNYPTVKIYGKVATSGDAAAANFSFTASDVGDGVVILLAIQTGTFNATTPVTLSGIFTTHARTASMVQTAPSMTGIVTGLLLAIFGTDTNNNTETYPTSGPTGMTRVGQIQGTPHYAMGGVYSQSLSSTAATGSKTVSPTPSGITTNGWTTTSLIVNPG